MLTFQLNSLLQKRSSFWSESLMKEFKLIVMEVKFRIEVSQKWYDSSFWHFRTTGNANEIKTKDFLQKTVFH